MEDFANIVFAILAMLGIFGATFMLNRRRNMQRDLDLIQSWSTIPGEATQSWDGTSEVVAAEAELEVNRSTEDPTVVENTEENQESNEGKIRGSDLDWDSV